MSALGEYGLTGPHASDKIEDVDFQSKKGKIVLKGRMCQVTRKSTIPSKPIDFDDFKVQEDINRVLQEFYKTFDITLSLTKLCKTELKDHLHLFIQNLNLWDNLKINKCISKTEVFCRCLTEGSEFATVLKDFRFYTLKSIITKEFGVSEDTLDGYEGYDSIFLESHLIHWKADKSDDNEWSYIPEEPGNKELRSSIKDTFREIVRKNKDKIHIPTREECLLSVKNASSYTYENNHTVFHGINCVDLKAKECTQARGKRVVVDVCPGGCRDTVIPSIDTLIELRKNSKIFSQICDLLPNSAMCKPLHVPRRTKFLIDDTLEFLMVDFRKLGLSFPHSLIKDLQDVIREELGTTLIDLTDIIIEDEKVYKRPKRGYCLGWFNEAPTIIQCLLFKVLKKLLPEGLFLHLVAYNDDGVWGIKKNIPDHIKRMVFRTIIHSYNSLNLYIHPKKLIRSDMNIFCEQYSQGDKYDLQMEKGQICTNLLAKALVCKYTSQCIGYLSDAIFYKTESTEHIIDKVIGECVNCNIVPVWILHCPGLFGGLKIHKENNLDQGYRDLENIGPYYQRMVHGYRIAFRELKLPKLYDMRYVEKAKVKKFERSKQNLREAIPYPSIMKEKAMSEQNSIFLDQRPYDEIRMEFHNTNEKRPFKLFFMDVFNSLEELRSNFELSRQGNAQKEREGIG